MSQVKSNQPFQFIVNFKKSTPLCATATTRFRGLIFFNRAQPFQTSTRASTARSHWHARKPSAPSALELRLGCGFSRACGCGSSAAARPRGFGLSTPFLTRRGSLGRAKVGRVTCTRSRVSRYVWRETGLVGLKVIVESQLAKCQRLLSARERGRRDSWDPVAKICFCCQHRKQNQMQMSLRRGEKQTHPYSSFSDLLVGGGCSQQLAEQQRSEGTAVLVSSLGFACVRSRRSTRS